METLEIKIATMDDIPKILPAFLKLRPHRTESELRKMFFVAYQEGYKVAYVGNDTLAFSILGFRILTFIFSGKTLKVDDLATLSTHKNNGYAKRLFEWVKQYARTHNCDHINLDSGFSRHDRSSLLSKPGAAHRIIAFRKKRA